MKICSIILSAGKSSRMKSEIPKPFHKIAGKKMIDWVIDVNKSVNASKIIIVGSQKEEYKSYIKDYNLVIQREPRGTGDAVQKAKKYFNKFNGVVLVCYGDTPFLKNTSSRTGVLFSAKSYQTSVFFV